ncbi:uncharacterized protein LOC106161284 isoform X1 [Lingula anatina]|uniref:Uncharacterized protein LOC106161284 isoform X1 n=1 Tax=Lingula anatina TaxID=7574 RepID=A0A1S3I5W1_LINAN|nr:uncharacterized protein LOC106161284 isoform X1 [Lingula anatina]|eukprot:XP_013393642.1 uncharacterized protein LOC106161284 isoform X1 [Lingula anatina]
MAVTVRSFSDAIELIRRHEEETAFHYVKDKRDKKRFESEISLHGDEKIFWNIAAKNGDFSIKYDGIPFVFLGKKTFLCQNGRDKGIFMKKRWKEKKEKLMKEDHVFIKNRFLQQPTKKMGCKARIEIKKIAKFPDFKVSTNSRGAKEGALKMLKKALQMKSSLAVDVQYLIYIPSKEEHQYHLTGEMGGYSEPVDPMVRSKVLELLENGLRSRRELEACVREYVVNQMFQGKEPPPKSRRRYFPHAVDFANLITKYKLQKRFSKIDQVNVEKMLQEVPSEYLCFFRGCSSTVEDIPSSVKEDTLDDDPVVDMEELSDVRECKMPGNKLLFVYQTPEMQRLYRIYGQTLLLDATYRTCRYALPLFFLVVRTNVDYQVVAFFVVQQETRESIAEALTIIRNRTPEVIPEYQQGNVKSCHLYRKWSAQVPVWLQDRPKFIFEDIWQKMQLINPKQVSSVTMIKDGEFTIASEQDSSKLYTVRLGTDSECCSCTCPSFQHSRMLCKHFFAVFAGKLGYGWHDISSIYRDHPVLNLDWELINATNPQELPLAHESSEDNNFDTAVDENELSFNLPLRRSTLKNTLISARSILKQMVDLSYKIDKKVPTEKLSTWVSSLEKCLSEVSEMVKRDGGLVLEASPLKPPPKKKLKRSTGSSLASLPKHPAKHPASNRVGKKAECLRSLLKPKLKRASKGEVPLPSCMATAEQKVLVTPQNTEAKSDTNTLMGRLGISVPTIWPNLYNGGRITIGNEWVDDRDMQTLQGSQWLNDKVINAYMNVIKEKHEGIFTIPSYAAVL